MKKIKNFLLLTLLTAATVTGCNKPLVEEAVKPIIGISAEGLSVKMDGNDVERTFTVTSDIAAKKDIAVNISTTASASDATIMTPVVVIHAGETTTTGKIKFLGSAFPLGAAAKDIKLAIASETANIAEGKEEIKYIVQGSDKPIVPVNATIICATTDIVVAGSDVEVPVTIKLDRPAEQYIEFTLIYGDKNTITEGAWTSLFPIFIDEGQTEVTFNVMFDGTIFIKGFSGVSHLNLTSNGADVDDKQTILINVTGVDPNKATLSTDGLDVVVGATDFSKTITLTLTENALTDAIFNVAVDGQAGDFEIVNKTITIKKGAKVGTGIIKFLKKAYPIALMTGTAIVTVTTPTLGIQLNEPNKILLNIKGTGTAPMGTVNIIESKSVKVGTTDKTVEFSVKLSEALTKTATFAITAKGDKADSFTLNTSSVVIDAGALVAKGTITFKAASFPYDTDKANVTLSIASDDVIIINSGKSIDFKVSGAALNPNKEDVRYHFENNNKKTVYVGKTGHAELSLFFINEGRSRPNKKVNNIYAEVTGGIEGIDYVFKKAMPMVVDPSDSPYGYIDINLLPAAKGKTLTLELFSDEATIGTNKSIQIEVIYTEWMPTTRSAPRLSIGSDGGDYAIKAPKVKIGSAEYSYTYPIKEWNNLYETKSFDVVQGDNTIEIYAFSVSDAYYTNFTKMAIYADFNNDGDFSDAGEEIALKNVTGLGVGEANMKPISVVMNVPSSAAKEFPIRMGLFINTGSDLTKVFQKGYFVSPGDDSNLRMSDFKAIVK